MHAGSGWGVERIQYGLQCVLILIGLVEEVGDGADVERARIAIGQSHRLAFFLVLRFLMLSFQIDS